MGKSCTPVGAAEGGGKMALVPCGHRGQNATGVFRHAAAQGAAQGRLEAGRPGAEASARPKPQHPRPIFCTQSDAVGVIAEALGGVRQVQREAAPDAAACLAPGQAGTLHTEPDSLSVHCLHPQHGAHPACPIGAADALHLGGQDCFLPGVSFLYFRQPGIGGLPDADANQSTQQHTDCITSCSPAFPPDQQAETNKNCRRRQQKPRLRQK